MDARDTMGSGDARFAASQATRWVLVSSSMELCGYLTLPGQHIHSRCRVMQRSTSNQAMQLTASKPVDLRSACLTSTFSLRRYRRGLAAADLVSR